MLIECIDAAMANASYEVLDDGTECGEVPGLQGVLANCTTLKGCREQLRESSTNGLPCI